MPTNSHMVAKQNDTLIKKIIETEKKCVTNCSDLLANGKRAGRDAT